ncbi:MAG: hypothetical protein JXR03_19615 [Cyclobacteriaceae bacterium]
MKKFTQLLTALVFGSLMIFISCGGGGGDDTPAEPDSRIEIGENFVKVASGAPDEVTFDTDTRSEWSTLNLTLTFNSETFAGTYTVTGIPDNEGSDAVFGVEGATGNWSFDDTTGSAITLNGIPMTATVTASKVTLTFNNEPGNRVAAFEGDWKFVWNL